MNQKALVCFIGWDHRVCEDISQQLNHFFGNYIDVKTWCLHETARCPVSDCRIFIASVPSVVESVQEHLPQNSRLLVAERALNVKNITKLLNLRKKSSVLVMAASRYGALTTIDLIERFRIPGIKMRPYYPGCDEAVIPDETIGIITGQDMKIPPGVNEVIDLGSKGINISTLVQLMENIPGIPKKMIDEITQSYVSELFHAGIEQYNLAEFNHKLKQEISVILDTVGDAIVSINTMGEIVVFNPAAAALLQMDADQAIGQHADTVLPELKLGDWTQKGVKISNEIYKIRGNLYVVSINPITGENNGHNGGVILLFRADNILQMEETMRRSLFAKGYVAQHSFDSILGESAAIRDAKHLAGQFASTELSILLEGATGTGKELFAQAIHNNSPRKNNAFVAVNLAALTESLAESELFGYVEGAFTGARKGGSRGLFEQAHKGTIFLDEIGEVSLEIQKKLLRVLENHEVRQVGSNKIIHVDVRVIAATNRDLSGMVKSGSFRMDLFYRLGTLPIRIPPLCDREDDILLLFNHFFVQYFNQKFVPDSQVTEFLRACPWPGNIRELQNVVQYIGNFLPHGGLITMKHLPEYILAERELNHMPFKTEGSDEKQYALFFSELEHNQKLRNVYAVLDQLSQAGLLGKGLGRSVLLKRLEKTGKLVSEYQVKNILALLETLGYCQSGITKQGTRLLPSGDAFLHYMKKRMESME
jgi:transcriptional regulator with PAS, ATPase and Fis domain